jgi:hypothetical protein
LFKFIRIVFSPLFFFDSLFDLYLDFLGGLTQLFPEFESAQHGFTAVRAAVKTIFLLFVCRVFSYVFHVLSNDNIDFLYLFRKIGGSKPARSRCFHFCDFLSSSIFSLQFHLNITFYDKRNIFVE